MATLHNLKPDKVIKAFERAGWVNKGQRGSRQQSLLLINKCGHAILDIQLPFSYIQRSPKQVPITKRRIGSYGSFERKP